MNQEEVAVWATEISEAQVNDLFRQIQAYSNDHPELNGADLRALAMTVITSTLVDVFAFCIPPASLDGQIDNIAQALKIGVPVARGAWDAKLGKKIKPVERQEFEIDLTCPFCQVHHIMAGEIGPEQRAPRDGDATMCAHCGEVAVFDQAAEGGARVPEIEELVTMSMDEGIQNIKKKWRQVKELYEASPSNPKTPWRYQ